MKSTLRDQGVNTTTQQTAGLIDERQVKELPLNGRSYDELLTLNPATVNYTGERSGGIGTSNSSVGNMFAVSGRRPQDNLFLLNGIEYTGASLINVTPGGTSGQLLGVDAVREFNVVDRHLRRQLRQARRRAGQHRHHVGHQSTARHGIRIHPQQRARCAQLLRPGRDSRIPAQPVRRLAGRSHPRKTSSFSSATTKASARTGA